MTTSGTQRFFEVLGVRVDAVQIPDVIKRIEEWIEGRSEGHFVFFTNVNNVMEASHDKAYGQILNLADLSVPDGMPLVWLGRLQGFSLPRRVYGPELLDEFCRQTQMKRYIHFFYGGLPGVAEALTSELLRRYPTLKIAGTYSPPFRPLTLEEDAEILNKINRATPDVLWVGLGCPKQERWICDHRSRLHVPVMAGVGQAFDIHSGRARQAPSWMRENGLEWVYRLLHEPRRLWRRYLIYGPKFAWEVSQELVGLRNSK